jgi:hypothetical protein
VATGICVAGYRDNGTGTCVPNCTARLCGSDGYGGDCGACGAGEICEPTLGICRIPTLSPIEPAAAAQPGSSGAFYLAATPDSVYTVIGWRDFVFMGEVYRFPRNPDGTLGAATYYGQPSTHLTWPQVLNDRLYLFGDNDATCCNSGRSDMAPIEPGGNLDGFVQIADLPYSANGWGTGVPQFSATRNGRVYISNSAKEDCCGMPNAPSVAALSAPVNPDGTIGTWRFEMGSAVPNRLLEDTMSLFMIRGDYAYVLTFDSGSREFSMYRASFGTDGAILDQHEAVNVGELNFLEQTHPGGWPLSFVSWKGDVIVTPQPMSAGDSWARLYWLKISPAGLSTHLVAVTEIGPAGATAQSADGNQVYLDLGGGSIVKANLPSESSPDGGV